MEVTIHIGAFLQMTPEERPKENFTVSLGMTHGRLSEIATGRDQGTERKDRPTCRNEISTT
jgi:hypothetical protein